MAAALALLTGCGSIVETPGPDFTVTSLFLYVRRGDMTSAWQEFAAPAQAPGAAAAVTAPDGRPGTDVRWPDRASFDRTVRTELAPLLSGARVTVTAKASQSASVTAAARPPSRARAFFRLVRVDNEWVITDLVVTGAG